MASRFPSSMAAITPEWLGPVLGAPVRSVSAATIGQGVGILGELGRLTVEYDDGGSGPATVVAKIQSPYAENRAVCGHFRFYEREVRFYQELAATAGIRVPECHFADIDLDAMEFTLILEDLGGGRFGDQVSGLSLDDAETALRALAGLHAANWGDPRLPKFDWLLPVNHPVTKSAQDRYQALWPMFLERFGHVITDDQRGLGERMQDRFHDVLDRAVTPPLLVAHGDFRADNFVFDLPDGDPFAVCDFQIVGQGHGGGFDVAYCLGGSVDRDIQQVNLERLLRTYHDALVAKGVKDYSYDELMLDTRLGSLICLLYPVNGADLDLANERGVALLERMARGYFGLASDLEAVAAL